MFENRVRRIVERFKNAFATNAAERTMLQLSCSDLYAEKMMKIACVEEVLSITDEDLYEAMTTAIPAGAHILFADMNYDTAIVLATATKVGLGDATTPDVLLRSSATVTKNTKTAGAVDHTISAATTFRVSSVDVNGAAAGKFDNGTAAAKIRVRIIYAYAEALPDAP